jgi:hypothetical protein
MRASHLFIYWIILKVYFNKNRSHAHSLCFVPQNFPVFCSDHLTKVNKDCTLLSIVFHEAKTQLVCCLKDCFSIFDFLWKVFFSLFHARLVLTTFSGFPHYCWHLSSLVTGSLFVKLHSYTQVILALSSCSSEVLSWLMFLQGWVKFFVHDLTSWFFIQILIFFPLILL